MKLSLSLVEPLRVIGALKITSRLLLLVKRFDRRVALLLARGFGW